MGYFAKQVQGQFRILPDDLNIVFVRIRRFAKAVEQGTYKLSGTNSQQILQARNLEEQFECWGCSVYRSADGGIGRFQYASDRLYPDHGLLLQVVGPYVVAGSYIELRGEDFATIRWEFDGTQCLSFESEAEESAWMDSRTHEAVDVAYRETGNPVVQRQS